MELLIPFLGIFEAPSYVVFVVIKFLNKLRHFVEDKKSIMGKIGSLVIKKSHDMHVGRVRSNLPEKLNGRFKLQLFESSGG
jgi:hypothetical protein